MEAGKLKTFDCGRFKADSKKILSQPLIFFLEKLFSNKHFKKVFIFIKKTLKKDLKSIDF